MADKVIVPVVLDLDQQSVNDVIKKLASIGSSSDAFGGLANEAKKGIEELEEEIKRLKKELNTAFDTSKIGAYSDMVDGLTDSQKENVKQAQKVVDSYDTQQEAVSALDAEIRQLQNDIKAGKKAQDTLIDLNQKGTDSYEQLNKEIADNIVKQKLLREEKKRLEKSVNREIKAATSLKGSYNDLVAQTNVLRNTVKDFRVGVDGTEEDLRSLQQQIRENNTELKEFDKQLGDNFRNVGNYSDGIKTAILESEGFGEVTGVLGGVLTKVSLIYGTLKDNLENAKNEAAASAKTFKIFGKSVNVSTKAVKVLNVALKASIIGAIIAAVTLLGRAFSTSSDGASRLEAIMLSAGDAFTIVSNAFTEFATNIFNVIPAIIEGFKSISVTVNQFGIPNGVTSDFSKLKEAISGITNPTKKAREQLNGLYDANIDFINSQKALQQEIARSAVEIAKLGKIEEELAELAGDATIALDEQRKFAMLSIKASQDRLNEEIRIAQKEKDLISERRKDREARLGADNVEVKELVKQENELLAVVIEKQQERSVLELQRARELRQINQDIFEQDLDFLLDFFDKRKGIIENSIADETKSFAERNALLQKLREDNDKNFQKETELFVKLANEQIDSSEEVLAAARKRVAESKNRSAEEQQIAKDELKQVQGVIAAQKKVQDQFATLDFEALVKEEDAEQLREFIRLLGQAEIPTARLSEVIREQQQIRLDNEVTQKELNAEQIEIRKQLTEKIEDLLAENIEDETDAATAVEKIRFERAKKEIEIEYGKLGDLEAVQKAIEELEKQHVRNLEEIQIDAIARREDRADSEEELEILRAKNAVNANIKSAKKREEAIAAIEEKALADKIKRKEEEIEALIKVAGEGSDEVLQAEIELEKLKQTQLLEEQKKGQNNRLAEGAQFAADALGIAAELSRKEQERLQKELDVQKENVEAQRKLAQEGAANTLAFEEAEADKRAQRLLEEQKREQRILKAKAIFELFNSFVSQGDGAATATAKAIAGTAIVEAAAKLGEGTHGTVADEVARQQGHIDSRGISKGRKHSQGGFLVEFEGSEGVLSGQEMANLGLKNFMAIKKLANRGRIGLDILDQESNIKNESRKADVAMRSYDLKGVFQQAQAPVIHKSEITAAGDYIDTKIEKGFKKITAKKRTNLR